MKTSTHQINSAKSTGRKAKWFFAAGLLSAGLVSPAQASINLERAIYICKSEAQQQLTSTPGSLRVKFKGVRGPLNAKKLRLQVLGDSEGAYYATCTIDTTHYGKVSLEKEQ